MTECRARRGVLAPLQKVSAEDDKGRRAILEFTTPFLSSPVRESSLAKTFRDPGFILLGPSLCQPSTIS